MKKKTALTLSVLLALTNAAYAKDLTDTAEEHAEVSYKTKDVDVAEAFKDPFGNAVTEQSYYRTGGDVNIIDRDALEKRHFNQLSDALKTVPGVLVRKPGYRGGEMGMENTHSILSINGDDRVIVLVDGRRVDNSASNVLNGWSEDGTKAMVDINQIINVNGIEKIEVIKGPGASICGSDATGGVINIITRKGGKKPEGTLDISTGAWKRHNYKLSYSGNLDHERLKYFISLSREMSGDGKYKDGLSGNTYRWLNTGYQDDAANIRIDYDFDKTHALHFAHNHMQGDDDYPLTAPERRYFNPTDWHRIITDWRVHRKRGEADNPGFRNLRYLWAATGAYNAYNKNNNDLTYTFHRDNGMESFIRIYNQHERYWGSFGMGDPRDPNLVPDTPAWNEWVNNHYVGRSYKGWFYRMENYGIQLQLGKAYGKHNVLSSLITMILMRERRHRWNARPSLAICRIRFLSRINLRSRRRSAMPVIQRRARWMGMGNAHRTGGRAAHSPHQSTCNMRLGREQVPISVIPVSIAPCAPRIIHQAMKIQPGDLCLPN